MALARSTKQSGKVKNKSARYKALLKFVGKLRKKKDVLQAFSGNLDSALTLAKAVWPSDTGKRCFQDE